MTSPVPAPGAPVGTVFFLHGLGGSGRAFERVGAALGARFDVIGIDLPGFGDAPATESGMTVAAMADRVLARIAEVAAPRWLLVGHSMGGKVASLVAARTLAGAEPVFGLAGMVLLAASPPTPEPMADDARAEMIAWVHDGPLSDAAARSFIADNVARDLNADDEVIALADLRRSDPAAWRAWLEHGSREDVSSQVGTLDLPVAILAGDDDADLGADAQPSLHGTVYPRARYVTLPDTGHLLPYERPLEVAAEIVRLWERIATAPAVPSEWAALIASPGTDRAVRRTLGVRALADDPDYAPRVLDAAQLATLRLLSDLVVPQPSGVGMIDLAARVDAQLARGEGDGWRVAGLPTDDDAYRAGLDALARLWRDAGDAGTAAQARGEVLRRVADREDGLDDTLGPEAFAAWFEDARVDLVGHWLSHPATMARTGYDGFATGGPPQRARSFVQLLPRTRDAWEPAELGREGARR